MKKSAKTLKHTKNKVHRIISFYIIINIDLLVRLACLD